MSKVSETSTPELAKRFSDLVVLPHTVFALPFAVSSFLLARRANLLSGIETPVLGPLVLIVLAVFFARSAAMGFNRLVDAKLDAKNPRTEGREIPSGKLGAGQVLGLVLVSSGLFVFVSGLLGWHCLVLSPLVLGILLGYSLTKRFTEYSHFALGLALACAPGGAWWVLRPEVEFLPLVMMATVVLWVGGFDILYSCQDVEFDRREGLHSIPAKLGVSAALRLARAVHLLAFIGFLSVGLSAGLGGSYFAGVLLIGFMLIAEHMIIKPRDLSRINRAFFTFNGFISLGYLVLIVVAANGS